MELCMHEKAVFFLPVNILMVWSLAFLAVYILYIAIPLNYIVLSICGPIEVLFFD